MKRTPRSTNRRAIKHSRPNICVASICIIKPVEPLGGGRLAVEPGQLGDGGLHPEGQLVIGDRRFQAIVMTHRPSTP